VSYFVHVYDPDTASDFVVPLDTLIAQARMNEDPDDVVHALIDAAQYERVVSHRITRGRFRKNNWNVATEPAGPLTTNTWHIIGISGTNRFNPNGGEGWRYTDDRNSRWVCRNTGWYDIDAWFRGSISAPAVHVCFLTEIHLALVVRRARTTPVNTLQLGNLDADNNETGIINLGDAYPDYVLLAGPNSATNYLRSWGITGGTAYPFYEGDEVQLVWKFIGTGIDFLDSLEARIEIQRIESLMTYRGCCNTGNPFGA